MVLYILRGAFIILVAVVAALYLLTNQPEAQVGFHMFVILIVVTLGLAGGLITLDAAFHRKRLSAISGIFLGLVAGLLAAYALSFVVDLFGLLTAPEVNMARPDVTPNSAEYFALSTSERRTIDVAWQAYNEQVEQRQAYLNLLEGVQVLIGLITCYFGISLVLQTKDDFRFIIPYVEFAKQIRGNRPIILDTSVIIDGRILDVVNTRILQGTLIVPKFVLEELQTVADSSDKLRRARGRRGLEILQKLQENQQHIDVMVDDSEPDAPAVDHKLIALAQQMQARVMTNDYNLNKIATLRGVDVININDLAQALRPVVLPGEQMSVKPVKPGESADQGVGYLEDGTMVVVEDGRSHLNEDVRITVTSTLQTSAGRMIFGRYLGPASADREAADTEPPAGDGEAGNGTGAGDGEAGAAESSEPAADARGAQPAVDAPSPPRPPTRPPRGRNPRRGGR